MGNIYGNQDVLRKLLKEGENYYKNTNELNKQWCALYPLKRVAVAAYYFKQSQILKEQITNWLARCEKLKVYEYTLNEEELNLYKKIKEELKQQFNI